MLSSPHMIIYFQENNLLLNNLQYDFFHASKTYYQFGSASNKENSFASRAWKG